MLATACTRLVWNRASRAACAAWQRRGQFRQDALDQLGLQLRKLALENLRHRTLDDLLEFLASAMLREPFPRPEFLPRHARTERTLP